MEKFLASGSGNLPYKMITGHRRNANLLYSLNEKYLYVKKKVHNNTGKQDWVCYQEILCKTDPKAIPCSSRVLLDPKTNMCTPKKIPHTNHLNHEILEKDLLTREKVYDDCIALKNLTDGLSLSIPAGEIFTRELAKYALKTNLEYCR